MKTYSQSGQDIFARLVIPSRPATFLDIGCAVAEGANGEGSNSLALEEAGWTGTLLDQNPKGGYGRISPFICADATKVKMVLPSYIDYLSLDVDGASGEALENLLSTGTRFGVITIEHDFYSRGDGLRAKERELLSAAGYRLICSNVTHQELQYEDWWVSPQLEPFAARFKSESLTWLDIEKLA